MKILKYIKGILDFLKTPLEEF